MCISGFVFHVNNSLFDLAGRTALVTGSSQGLGFAIARGLAQAGAAVVLNGRDAKKLSTAAGALDVKAARVAMERSVRRGLAWLDRDNAAKAAEPLVQDADVFARIRAFFHM